MLYEIVIPILIASLSVHSFQVEKCKEEMELGRNVLRSMASRFVEQEHRRQGGVLQKLLASRPSKRYTSIRFAATDATTCPQANITMLSPPPTSTPSTTLALKTTTIAAKATTTTGAKATTATGAKATTTTAAHASTDKVSEGTVRNDPSLHQSIDVSQREDLSEVKEGLNKDSNAMHIPAMFHGEPENDPYILWMRKLYNHLNLEEAVCNGPKFQGINTVTKDQLWGFFALFLTNHASPLCSICDGVFAKVEQKIMQPNPFVHSEEERFMMSTVLAYLPQTMGLCSMLLPSCHQDYQLKAVNISETTECLKCPLCMAGLSLAQHRFLLDEKTIQDALDWLQGNIFHNICAELCTQCLPAPGNETKCEYFPDGVDYNQCMNFTRDLYNFIVEAARNVLKPEYFCSVELEWCEVNDSPNIMNCLREICMDGLPEHAGSTICKIIPSDPILAQNFISAHHKHNEL